MTDAETRAELERIDSTCSAWWDLLVENNDLSSEEGKMLRLLAESQQEIEILKTDLHIANRALEIHLTTVELRKQVVADRIELKKITEDRDLLEKGLDSAMRQVSSLNQGNIADRKRIGMLLLVKDDLNKHIADQTATIERLRIATECIETITCEDDKMIKNPETGKWEEDQNWGFVYKIVHVATARCKADHSDWEKEMMEFYEGYVKRSGTAIVEPLGHKHRQALDVGKEK